MFNCFSAGDDFEGPRSANRRFALRAVERFGVAEDDVSIMCCQSFAISGDMEQLVQHLPTAVMRTFNRHPRLRALVLREDNFMAEVQPQISLNDVVSKKLLRVRVLSESEEDVEAWKNWKEFVCEETDTAIDRFTQFMLYLTVWVNKAESKARFYLFADHIMWDGESGSVVLNDILEDIALLSIEAAKPVKEFPLRPSMYDMWLTDPWWLKPVGKTILALFGSKGFTDFMKMFKPVLTPREDQHDFGIPFKKNTTTLLCKEGDPANMRDTLQKCKEEGVTLGGALVPMIVLAFYHASKVDHKIKGEDEPEGPFRFVSDICYNMRQRMPNPAPETQIGLYVTNTPLKWLATEGVDIKKEKFWDLARISKEQMATQSAKLLEMVMPCFLMDRKLNKPMVGGLLGDFKIPSSCTGDATVSNVGRYPCKTQHILAANGVLRVEDMYGFCAIPFVATSSTLWLGSVNSFNYSLAHKVNNEVGNELFRAYTTICENASSIGADDTMEEVLKRFGIEPPNLNCPAESFNAMSCASSESAPGGNRRVALRAIERFGIAEPDVSVKCCHAIAIGGDMEQLACYLPTAVMRVFNRHPRMRLTIVKDEEFMGEIQPQITLDDVAAKKLCRVRQFSESEEDVKTWKNWSNFVQTETDLPFDRFTEFMFYLTVWVNRAESKARFFLFSDHIVADGDSGMVVVNDILEDIALLSIEAAKPVQESPLRPSLYDMWFSEPWWLKPVAKTVLAVAGGSAFINFMKAFKPVLTPREDQEDFGMPFVKNSTTLLCAAGSPTNMRDTLRKCKEEGATMGGALIAMIVLAFYHASKVDHKIKGEEQPESPFRFVADISYNMRQRVPNPAPERQVGLYVTNTPLKWLATEGVDMRKEKFWDLARVSKEQMATQSAKLLEMALPCFMMDRKLTKPSLGQFFGDYKIPSSCTGDTTISNVGRYLYKKEHILGSDGVLRVEDMYGFCAIPFVAASSTMWLTTVNSFHYSIAHKVGDEVGKELFKAYTTICENASNIRADDTMEEVLKRVGLDM
ncbi:hypothetical protein BBJ29_001069 [Phytophthora kernoviae]|uniref:Condensation domain-containing protein n=1 Tax=Phytophthora kernoviae TaxID=325452 RepID=A0A3F2S0V8_9STRA|nr:hypothetical protein BBJ29_001069 [Phytophthora kernoviae]RLN67526.1 hypothetical protein BBP00_00001555 [Phytophthora kernoviae]